MDAHLVSERDSYRHHNSHDRIMDASLLIHAGFSLVEDPAGVHRKTHFTGRLLRVDLTHISVRIASTTGRHTRTSLNPGCPFFQDYPAPPCSFLPRQADKPDKIAALTPRSLFVISSGILLGPNRITRMKWIVYILECSDNSLYTGITNEMERRLEEHRTGRGAKYTKHRRPLRVRYTEYQASKSAALKREAAIKSLNRSEKLALIATWPTIEYRGNISG